MQPGDRLQVPGMCTVLYQGCVRSIAWHSYPAECSVQYEKCVYTLHCIVLCKPRCVYHSVSTLDLDALSWFKNAFLFTTLDCDQLAGHSLMRLETDRCLLIEYCLVLLHRVLCEVPYISTCRGIPSVRYSNII